MSKTSRNWSIVLGLELIVWICPNPEGLTPKAWHLFAISIATIDGFILQSISIGSVA
ncbi:anion permease, partial [Turicimonas muris]|uniref:anion permease n=1 Tax=Turicimonas muris TaxID=1796652 RepID=UPI002592A603